MTEVPVYAWADGTRAELILRQQVNKSAYFRIRSPGLVLQFFFDIQSQELRWGEVFGNTHNKTAVEDLNRKMVGFILDLGVKRPDANAFNGFMVESPWVHSDAKFNLFGACPRFVSDELWAKRFDIPTSPDDDPRFLVEKKPYILDGYEILGYCNGTTIDLWFHGNQRRSGTRIGNTKEEVIEAILIDLFVLPESARQDWEAANVERGVFLIPSPDEVEMYRALGEPIPLLWPLPGLQAWLEERLSER